MNTLLGFLSGYKTYVVAAGALFYAIGIHFGWWVHYPDIDLAFGGAGAITIRAAIKNLCQTVSSAMDKIGPAIALAALLPLSLGLTSCATVLPGNDPVVVNAERTTALAVDIFDTFLQFEYSNRAGVAKISPEVHAYAEVIRRNGQGWLQNARALTRAYKLNRSAENKANLGTAIAVLQAGINLSQSYLTNSAR